jgi:hypothetical protein
MPIPSLLFDPGTVTTEVVSLTRPMERTDNLLESERSASAYNLAARIREAFLRRTEGGDVTFTVLIRLFT